MENITTISVEFYIPTPLVEKGAIELYASKKTDWTPESIDENGNPITALQAASSFLRKRVKEDFAEILAAQGAEIGKAKAIEDFNKLFTIDL